MDRMAPPVKRRIPWLAVLFTLLAVGIALAIALGGGRPVHVRVMKPARGVVEDLVTSNSVGSVEPVQTAVVAAEVAGRLLRIHVRQGPLKARALVFEIDSSDLRAEREVTAREIDTARARVVQASLQKKKVWEDIERLKTVDVPRGDVERLQRDLEISRQVEEVAKLQIGTLEAQLAVLDHRIGKTKVLAPFDGTLVALHAEEGESVVPGKALYTIHSADLFRVRAPIDEVDVGRLRVGMPVRVGFESYPDRKFPGTLGEILPAATTDKKNNRTVDIRIDVPALPVNVLAGMSANIEVIVAARENVLSLPTHLVNDDRAGRGRFVFVAEGGLAKRRFVKVGLSNWETLEILEGLGPGDVVLVPSRSDEETPLKEGLKVAPDASGP
jgi:HlyD family secretion protein